MCSFLIYNYFLVKNKLNKINKFLKLRGPDKTNVYKYKKYTFVHNILHITGELKIQPFIFKDIICLFNGEIYNFKDFNDNYKSDGQCLIPLYLQYVYLILIKIFLFYHLIYLVQNHYIMA